MLSYLNEGNTVKFRLGRMDQVNDINMFISKVDINPSGDDQYSVRLEGLLDASDYVSFRRCRTSNGPERSVEVIKRVVEMYFDYRSNIQGTDNRQIWVQPSISDRHFVTNLWRSTYIPESWPAVAITAFNPTFRLIDVFKLLRKVPVDWELGPAVGDGDRRIPILAGVNSKTNSGIINQLYGYPTKLRVESLDDGISGYVNQEVKPLWSNKLNRRRRLRSESRVGKLVFRNENHHDKFHHANLNNPAWGSFNVYFKGGGSS